MDYLAHNNTMDGHMHGGAAWGWLFMLTLLAAAIAVIVMAVRYISSSSQSSSRGETAQEILDKRYAKGEISKKEFNELKKDLANKK